jgi:peptide deformylase
VFKKVVYWPHKALRTPTEKVDRVDERVLTVCDNLLDTMNFLEGVGMAAPQIGDNNSIFVISNLITGKNETIPTYKTGHVFINPEIVSVDKELEKGLEGCLSFPEIYINVPRPKSVVIKALDIEGQEFEVEVRGLLARALQHEYDHLSGKLMIDFVGKLKKNMVKKKIFKWKKNHE